MFFGTAQIVLSKLNFLILDISTWSSNRSPCSPFWRWPIAGAGRACAHGVGHLAFVGQGFWFAEVLSILASLVFIADVGTQLGHFLRAWETVTRPLTPNSIWPTKLMVPVALSILWLRLLLQFLDISACS